jgi:hypothetical protein
MGGKPAASVFRPVGVPRYKGDLLPMDLVQLDHTAVDVATRAVPGFCVSPEPPSTMVAAAQAQSPCSSGTVRRTNGGLRCIPESPRVCCKSERSCCSYVLLRRNAHNIC